MDTCWIKFGHILDKVWMKFGRSFSLYLPIFAYIKLYWPIFCRPLSSQGSVMRENLTSNTAQDLYSISESPRGAKFQAGVGRGGIEFSSFKG